MSSLAPQQYYQPLIWIKPELDVTIKNIRTLLEEYSLNLKSNAPLINISQELYLLKGSLEILEFFGAGLLVEDMSKAVEFLISDQLKDKREVFEALLQATLSIDAYIDKLHKDQNDIPLTLLPIANDIRASINEPLLSESALFLPNLSIVPKTPEGIKENQSEVQLSETAKSLRPYYQAALLTWIKDSSDHLSIQQLKLVVRNLESASLTPRNRQIWWILGGIFEALSDKGLKSNIALRVILGQADRVIKSLIHDGEDVFEKKPPIDLLKNALYYISRASSNGKRVETLKHVYQLDQVMPSEKDLSVLRNALNEPNSTTLSAIAKELKKYLDQSKAVIDNFSRNTPEDTDRLASVITPLKHIADTLTLLSLGNNRNLLTQQIRKLEAILLSKESPSKETLLSLATSLLQVDSTLQNINNTSKKNLDWQLSKSKPTTGDEMSTNNINNLPDTEYRLLIIKAATEAKKNIEGVKNNILAFLASEKSNFDILQNVPYLLFEIQGSLEISNNHYAANIVGALNQLISDKLLNETEKNLNFDVLAEIIVSIEYYLEAIAEERSPTTPILDQTQVYLKSLGYAVSSPKDSPKSAPILEAVVTHISAAPTLLKVNALSLPKMESTNDLISDEKISTEFDEIDEEVAEIFIEEAFEELTEMTGYLKTLKFNLNDTDALNNIRRAYHTLKGSGKIAGANDISEFADIIEQYLSLILCGAKKFKPESINLLNNCQQFLFELTDCFKNKSPAPEEIDILSAAISRAMEPETAIPNTRNENQNTHNRKFVSQTTQAPKNDNIDADELDSILQSTVKQLNFIENYIKQYSINDSSTTSPEKIYESIVELHKCAERTNISEFIQTTDLLSKYINNLNKNGQEVDLETVEILKEFCTTTIEILNDLPSLLSISDTPQIEEPKAPDVLEESSSVEEISVLQETSPSEEKIETTTELTEIVTEEKPGNVKEFPTFDEKIPTIDDFDDDIDLINIFMEEAVELIARGNEVLVSYHSDKNDSLLLSSIQRLLHTMKGSARMAGVTSVGNLAHTQETLLELVITNNIVQPENLVELIQASFDAINDIIEDIQSNADIRMHHELLEKLELLTQPQPVDNNIDIESNLPEETIVINTRGTIQDEQKQVTKSDIDNFLDDKNNLEQNEQQAKPEEITAITTIESMNDSDEQLATSDINRFLDSHTLNPTENIQSNIETEAVTPEEIVTVEAYQNNDVEQISITGKDDKLDVENTVEQKIEHSTPEQDIPVLSETTDSIPETKTVSKKIPAHSPTIPVVAQKPPEKVKSNRRKKNATHDIIRVNTDTLDAMINMANDGNATNSRIEDHIHGFKSNLLELDKTISRSLAQMRDLQFEVQQIKKSSSDVEFNTRDSNDLNVFSEEQKTIQRLMESIGDIENIHSTLTRSMLEADNLFHQQKKMQSSLYESLLNTRMVTFSIQTQRMQRILRQTCKELNKKATLTLEGTDGSIDRSLLEKLMGPMEHVIRNAIAHGIESPNKRKTLHKNKTGNVKISFSKEKSEHLIEIQDDGAGIDVEKVRQRAIDHGLIDETDDINDDDLKNIIFESGFSTSDEISQISGRGIGMDAVLDEIQQLGGTVSISSQAGTGSRFSIRVPFTSSRNHTLFVAVSNNTYALPSSSIIHSFPVDQKELEKIYTSSNPHIEFENCHYPLWHMNALLNKSETFLPDKQHRAHILLVQHNHKFLALQVDEINETRDSVLQPTNPMLSELQGIAGTTVLGSGKVVLIIDVPALIKLSDSRSNKPHKIIYSDSLNEKDSKINALIVDDSVTVRKITQRFLIRHGMLTATAKDGIEALEKLQEEKPDIILLDIEMPNMDGLELAKRIKSDDLLHNIPVIMITSRTGQHHKQSANDIGIEVFLGKPYQESELLGYIQALTGKRTHKNA